MAGTPVFLNSSFRTGSTWLWEKLRRLPTTVAYYEYFNESLSRLTRASATLQNSQIWPSKHPTTAPYFIEFLPLLNEHIGVRGFDSSMAFDRFLPSGGFGAPLSEGELQYTRSLIENAHRQGKTPILSETRTLGRAASLRREFGGKSVFLYRNLFHQWASYTKFACGGNSYFLDTINKITRACRHDEVMRMLDEYFVDRTSSPRDEKLFSVFLLSHLRLYAANYDECDLEFDVTAMPRDQEMRSRAQSLLGEWAGSPIDLSDIRRDFEFSVFTVSQESSFISTIEQFTKQIASLAQSNRGSDFIYAQKDAALEEWQRYEFYTRPLRSKLMAEPTPLQTVDISIHRLHYRSGYLRDGKNLLMRDEQIQYDASELGAIDEEVLFFGPYMPLSSGSYTLQLIGKIEGETTLRLHCSGGRTLISEMPISGDATSVAFDLAEDVADLEILLFRSPKLSSLKLSSIQIRKAP